MHIVFRDQQMMTFLQPSNFVLDRGPGPTPMGRDIWEFEPQFTVMLPWPCFCVEVKATWSTCPSDFHSLVASTHLRMYWNIMRAVCQLQITILWLVQAQMQCCCDLVTEETVPYLLLFSLHINQMPKTCTLGLHWLHFFHESFILLDLRSALVTGIYKWQAKPVCCHWTFIYAKSALLCLQFVVDLPESHAWLCEMYAQ